MDSIKGFVYLTKDRLHEIETELNNLKINGRKHVAEQIAEARSHGDLSENAEYDAAKAEQEHLELKIRKLEDMLTRVKIIAAHDMPDDKIYILHNVKLRDLKTKEEFKELIAPFCQYTYGMRKHVPFPYNLALCAYRKRTPDEIRTMISWLPELEKGGV